MTTREMPVKEGPSAPFRVKLSAIHIKNGVRQPEKVIKTNSWVLQMPKILQMAFTGAPFESTHSIKDIDGVVRAYGPSSGTNRTMDIEPSTNGPTFGQDRRGMMVGTGTTPPGRDDFNLENQIFHGTGPGQMEYQAQAILPIQAITNGYRYTLERQFDNNSGASITVKEVGAAVQSFANAEFLWFLILHDAVDEPVAAGDQLIFQYHLEFSE